MIMNTSESKDCGFTDTCTTSDNLISNINTLVTTRILQLLQNGSNGSSSRCNNSVNSNHIVNGRNVMLMPTRDCYTFGLDLMIMHFTPEELGEPLVYASSKTGKPGLDKDRASSY